MCVPGLDPVTLAMIAASTAASAGGAALNVNAQNDAIRAQNEQDKRAQQISEQAAEAERVRQLGMEQQQTEAVSGALAEADPAKALLAAQAEAAAPANKITQASDTYTAAPVTTAFQNKDIDAQTAAATAERAASSDSMADALALLTGIGSQFAGANRAIGRSGSEIATIGGNRRGSAGVAQMEGRIPAAEVTANPGLLGDLLMIGGQAAGGMAGARAGKSGFEIGDILLPGKKKAPLGPLPKNLGTGALY